MACDRGFARWGTLAPLLLIALATGCAKRPAQTQAAAPPPVLSEGQVARSAPGDAGVAAAPGATPSPAEREAVGGGETPAGRGVETRAAPAETIEGAASALGRYPEGPGGTTYGPEAMARGDESPAGTPPRAAGGAEAGDVGPRDGQVADYGPGPGGTTFPLAPSREPGVARAPQRTEPGRSPAVAEQPRAGARPGAGGVQTPPAVSVRPGSPESPVPTESVDAPAAPTPSPPVPPSAATTEGVAAQPPEPGDGGAPQAEAGAAPTTDQPSPPSGTAADIARAEPGAQAEPGAMAPAPPVLAAPPTEPITPAPSPETPAPPLESSAPSPSVETPPATVSAETPPATARLETAEIEEFRASDVLKDVFFDFDRYEIRPDGMEALDANAQWLRSNEDYLVLVEGHCDERGTNEYNIALGEHRARAAMNYLVAHGVAADRISTFSYGEERPFCADRTEDCWAENRRAHFLIKRGADRGSR
jgi:peptidoglycan-associated lipoprotein